MVGKNVLVTEATILKNQLSNEKDHGIWYVTLSVESKNEHCFVCGVFILVLQGEHKSTVITCKQVLEHLYGHWCLTYCLLSLQ